MILVIFLGVPSVVCFLSKEFFFFLACRFFHDILDLVCSVGAWATPLLVSFYIFL